MAKKEIKITKTQTHPKNQIQTNSVFNKNLYDNENQVQLIAVHWMKHDLMFYLLLYVCYYALLSDGVKAVEDLGEGTGEVFAAPSQEGRASRCVQKMPVFGKMPTF